MTRRAGPKLGPMGTSFFWNEQKDAVYKADKIYIGGTMKGKKDDGYHFVTYPGERIWKSILTRPSALSMPIS